jgi:hypothetical protein
MHSTGSLYVGSALTTMGIRIILLKDNKLNIFQGVRNAEKADSIKLCFSPCAFVSYQLIGVLHFVSCYVCQRRI